ATKTLPDKAHSNAPPGIRMASLEQLGGAGWSWPVLQPVEHGHCRRSARFWHRGHGHCINGQHVYSSGAAFGEWSWTANRFWPRSSHLQRSGEWIYSLYTL